ncbi:MAG: helix-turn-helix domain-containing protein [Solirubrobacteraceae bacterium]
MALPRDYAGQRCSVARALEIVGERWTLLIVRDAFYGLRRFGDFALHLEIPRAVLTSRLRALVDEGVMERVPGPGARDEYALTEKGERLWPVVRELMHWGDDHYSPDGPRRIFRHRQDDGLIGAGGRCATCGALIAATDTTVTAGPGFEPGAPATEPALLAFQTERRLLEPARPA